VRLANDAPIGLHVVHLPADLAARIGFDEDALRRDRTLSLYALLERAGVPPVWAEEQLRSRLVTAAEARLIGASPGAPVMDVLRLTRNGAGDLIEAVRAVYLGAAYNYVIHLERRPFGAAAPAGVGIGSRIGQEVAQP
jgi:DNA-binding GntR family transcriptional regulator